MIAELESGVLVGHSMGGKVTLSVAARDVARRFGLPPRQRGSLDVMEQAARTIRAPVDGVLDLRMRVSLRSVARR